MCMWFDRCTRCGRVVGRPGSRRSTAVRSGGDTCARRPPPACAVRTPPRPRPAAATHRWRARVSVCLPRVVSRGGPKNECNIYDVCHVPNHDSLSPADARARGATPDARSRPNKRETASCTPNYDESRNQASTGQRIAKKIGRDGMSSVGHRTARTDSQRLKRQRTA